MKKYYVYILSNKNGTVLYIGYTDNINRRLKQHKKTTGSVFTKKYNVTELLFFESFDEMKVAKDRERQLKNWRSDWKWDLVKMSNPDLKEIEIR